MRARQYCVEVTNSVFLGLICRTRAGSIKLRNPLTFLIFLSLLWVAPSISGAGYAHAEKCKISSANLVFAYQKAKGNGFEFVCLAGKFLPLPTEWVCQGKRGMKLGDVGGEFLFRFDSKGEIVRGLKNGWKIIDYQLRGTAFNMRKHSSDAIRFSGRASARKKFSMKIQAIWIEKPGASCNNIHAVLTSAFGR